MLTKIDIISGFLGAGKTTLIKKLLSESYAGKSTALIENEFGEIGIDGVLLQQSGMQVREINSGCICCTMAGDFNSALKDVLRKYQPERIVIEPSGVAKLSDTVETCARFAMRENVEIDAVIAVADVTKYRMYSKNFGEFYNNQIQNAKAVVLSRTQTASPEILEAAVKGIREQNPGAAIITTPWEQLAGNAIFSAAERGAAPLLLRSDVLREEDHHHCSHNCEAHGHHHEGHSADEVFEVYSVQTPKKFHAEKLDALLQKLEEPSYGTVLRAKGIVETKDGSWLQFDYVPGEQNKSAISAEYTGRLCVIGKELNRDRLAALFGI